jgi:hypothetical protein
VIPSSNNFEVGNAANLLHSAAAQFYEIVAVLPPGDQVVHAL